MAVPSTSVHANTLDLDHDAPFQTALETIGSSECKNFAVFFNIAEATSTTNLKSDSLLSWHQSHNPESGVRWYNFWVDHDQRPLIESLAREYNVSPRLIGFLCPAGRSNLTRSTTEIAQSNQGLVAPSQNSSDIDDIEKTVSVHANANTVSTLDAKEILERIGVADLVENLWHFCTIDWGHRYVYIGVNTLSSVPGARQPSSSDLPSGQRLWSSLLLCDDGTLISTCQRPQPHDNDTLTKSANKVARRHVSNIFRHLSRAKTAGISRSGDLTSVSIRPDSHEGRFNATETSSLLFYYLWDDWMTTYALIARIEHPYREKLEEVRRELTTAPNVTVLETLHRIGRQLTVLKQMYQSYAQMISRLLHRYRIQAQNPHSPLLTRFDSNPNASQLVETYDDLDQSRSPLQSPPLRTSSGIHISIAALMRFERLLDRIHLYALNEIEHCLNEKESMVFMAFNLLTLSESHTIEKLTRVTVVLAKATILFLPLSLLTAYFSIQIGNIQSIYSLRTYWLSFMVVSVLSIMFLVVYGIKTKTLEFKFRNIALIRELSSKKQKRP